MSLSLPAVRQIADLARIAVTDAELAQVRAELNGILELVAQLRAVDTAGIEPMAHALGLGQRLRADAVTEADQRDILQALAPQAEDGLYLVPQVIE